MEIIEPPLPRVLMFEEEFRAGQGLVERTSLDYCVAPEIILWRELSRYAEVLEGHDPIVLDEEYFDAIMKQRSKAVLEARDSARAMGEQAFQTWLDIERNPLKRREFLDIIRGTRRQRTEAYRLLISPYKEQAKEWKRFEREQAFKSNGIPVSNDERSRIDLTPYFNAIIGQSLTEHIIGPHYAVLTVMAVDAGDKIVWFNAQNKDNGRYLGRYAARCAACINHRQVINAVVNSVRSNLANDFPMDLS